MTKTYIFSGGGTGGHIFPAVAIAKQLIKIEPQSEILFVGANGKMEMDKIPNEGFNIIGLPIRGLVRSLSLRNFQILLNALKSYQKAKKIIKEQQPIAVFGTGGYASLPIGLAAAKYKVPLFIWEGNGHAGLSNKILQKRARKIYCGFDGMDKQFPFGNWKHSGNPVRIEMLNLPEKSKAADYFGLKENLPTVFITGGSLGAKSINLEIEKTAEKWLNIGIQIIWQTGKLFKHNLKHKNLWSDSFIKEMPMAYALADLVISRSGALSVSEIMVTGVPAIFIPSPNVTDDHQTKNALKATQTGGAVLLEDHQLESLDDLVIELIEDHSKRKIMREKLLKASKPNATEEITLDMLSNI